MAAAQFALFARLRLALAAACALPGGGAAAAISAVSANVRPPLLSLVQLTGGDSPLRFAMRSGEGAPEVATAACSVLADLGRPCSAANRTRLQLKFQDSLARVRGASEADLALGQVRFGWELSLLRNEVAEARLQFLRSRLAFPRSRFLAREMAAFLLLVARRGDEFIKHSDGTWSYAKRRVPDEDAQYLEIYESHSVLRYEAPSEPMEVEEEDLLMAGAAPRALFPDTRPYESASKSPEGEWSSMEVSPWPRGITPDRLEHDLGQWALLKQRGLLDSETADRAIALYTEVLASARKSQVLGKLAPSDEQWRLLFPFYNRRVYVHPCHRTAGPAIAFSGSKSVWHSGTSAPSEAGGELAQGGVIVVDGLLSEQSLRRLLDFSELSTIWYKEYGTYLGATMWSGMSTPLLAQISEELHHAFPEVLCDLSLLYVWAFKFADSLEDGITIHADKASVNVNIWLTPDDQNLDQDSGGLIIYDASVAGTNLTFSDYNGNIGNPARELLEQTSYRNITVPYRQNRAVIFDSQRLHQTQKFSFKSGIQSRRINLTFLFGQKGIYCPKRRME